MRIPILMYHQIADPTKGDRNSELYCVPTRVFASHMWYLRLARYTPVTMTRVARFLRGEETLPRRPVAVTFDDGYENTYTNAFPILRRFGFPATVYLVAGLIGQTNRWDEAEGFPSARLMDEAQIMDMARHGTEFGVHTLTHPHLAEITPELAVQEVSFAKGYLEELVGTPMNTMAYPYGPTSFNKVVRRIVINSGYLAACGTYPGCSGPDDDLYFLRRHFPKSFTNLPRFVSLLGKMPSDYRTEEDYWK